MACGSNCPCCKKKEQKKTNRSKLKRIRQPQCQISSQVLSLCSNNFLSTDTVDKIVSNSGAYQARIEPNGVFCVKGVADGDILWCVPDPATPPKPSKSFRVTVQKDGNLCAFDASQKNLWCTKSSGFGKAPYKLLLENEGNLALYDFDSKRIWETGTKGLSSTPTGAMCPFVFKKEGQCVTPNDLSRFNMAQIIGVPALKDQVDMLTKMLGGAISKKTGFELCFGDFKAADMKAKTLCSAIPLNPQTKLGYVYVTSNIPCPDMTTLEVCVAFDQCGTVALSLNPKILNCVSSSTGPGKIIGLLAKFTHHASAGFSLNRKFEMNAQIFHPNEAGDATISDFTIKGHIFIEIELQLPDEWNEKYLGKLAKVLEIHPGKGTAILDINILNEKGKSDMFKTLAQIKSGDVKGFFKLVYQVVAELYLEVNSYIVLKLGEVTHGILPNLTFNLFHGTALFVVQGGNTGLAKGFYISCGSGKLPNIADILPLVLAFNFKC